LVNAAETALRDRIVSQLKELDLTTSEAAAYVSLLTHPNTTAGTLCKETSIPDSKIYYALDGLSKKGMITVQQGNPNLYNPVPPKEAISSLKQQLSDKMNEKFKEADMLAERLTPLYDTAEKPEELEIAYIIRGQRNIVNRMKSLIETATKEVTVFIPNKALFNEIKEALRQAVERRVKVNLAVTPEVNETEAIANFGEVRRLCCVLGLLISDMKTLLTLTNWTNEIAVVTQDQNLMRICRDYYDNPACCTQIENTPQSSHQKRKH
jgi:sugar-specific transcriptional regulator TrmB